MNHAKFAGLLIVLLAVWGTCTWAESKPAILTFGRSSDQPTNISAQKGTGRSIPGGWESTFKGNVKVEQGELVLTCDLLTVIYEEKKSRNKSEDAKRNPQRSLDAASDIKSITAAGHVNIVQGETRAVAGKAIYEHSNRTITLKEQPLLWHGGGKLEAETIVIYLDENRTEFLSGNGPVKAIINPAKQQKEKER